MKVLTLIGLLMYSCQNEEDYAPEKQETAIDTSNLVYFNCIPVPHRFKINSVNLEKDETDKFNFVLKEKRIKNGINYARQGVETSDVEKFSEAVDKRFTYFLYQEGGFDMEMLKKYFLTLSEEQIATNWVAIASYYSRNLYDMVAIRYLIEFEEDEDYGGGDYYNPTPLKMAAITTLKKDGEDIESCTLRELS